MREVSVSKVISADREAIFDFVCDLASRPAYADHYLRDYRLARVNAVGEGAAARFQVKAPLAKEYAELQIKEVDRPRRVELTTYGEPATLVDRFKQTGAAGWLRRQTRKQLERLRMIFEEAPKEPLKRATIAGYEPSKAARFGAPTGTDPARVPPH